jgi:hypothetical protein
MRRIYASAPILFLSLTVLQGINLVGFYFACSKHALQTTGAEIGTILYALWFGIAYFIPAIILTNGYINGFAAVYEDAGIGFQLKQQNHQFSASVKASAAYILAYLFVKNLGGSFCANIFPKDAILAGNIILGLFWDRPLLFFWLPIVFFYLALRLTGGRVEEIRKKDTA